MAFGWGERIVEGRARRRLLTAWAIVLSLAINLVLPALLPSTAVGLPFDDVQICAAHPSIDSHPAADKRVLQLCPMCLLLGHQAAFAPTGPVPFLQPARLAGVVARPPDATSHHRSQTRPQTARGPPFLA